jgi:hypothetical protein
MSYPDGLAGDKHYLMLGKFVSLTISSPIFVMLEAAIFLLDMQIAHVLLVMFILII